MPNFWKAQTEPRSLALWKNTEALRDGGMEWGKGVWRGRRSERGAKARHRRAF